MLGAALKRTVAGQWATRLLRATHLTPVTLVTSRNNCPLLATGFFTTWPATLASPWLAACRLPSIKLRRRIFHMLTKWHVAISVPTSKLSRAGRPAAYRLARATSRMEETKIYCSLLTGFNDCRIYEELMAAEERVAAKGALRWCLCA